MLLSPETNATDAKEKK